jgi:uncharacterized protein (TIGR02466 family)
MSPPRTIRSLFATPVAEVDLSEAPGFAAEREALEAACRAVAREDLAGRDWCRRNLYRGYTSYASLTDLPTRDPAFGQLKRRLDLEVRAFAQAAHLDLGARKLRLDSLWINILKAGGAHTGHIHPHSVVSGALYVATPPGAGQLKLEDPRLPMMMASPTRSADAPDWAKTFVYLTPRAGTLFLWESWLRHEVTPNQAKSDRISISFNYGWV